MQRDNKGKRVVLYPEYFDSRLSRGKGRRVPKDLAVKAPTPEEIARVAREQGFEAYVEPAKYPRVWWSSKGRVIVEKKGMSKTRIIKIIAQGLYEARRRRGRF